MCFDGFSGHIIFLIFLCFKVRSNNAALLTHLQQRVLATCNDKAELKDPDVGEEAVNQQHRTQEGHQDGEHHGENVLQNLTVPVATQRGVSLHSFSCASFSDNISEDLNTSDREENCSKDQDFTCWLSSKHILFYLPKLKQETFFGSSCQLASMGAIHYVKHQLWTFIKDGSPVKQRQQREPVKVQPDPQEGEEP